MSASATPTPGGIVILGAGQAGVQLADSLRQAGYVGLLTLIGDEVELPYQRPPLSKDFIAAGAEGREGAERAAGPAALPLRGTEFYAANEIDARFGIRALSVDRSRRTVLLADGTELGYNHLVFATGARNRALTIPGHDLAGVHGMRTLDDARKIRAQLDWTSHVVVIGAGFIGLEFAASAARRDIAVTVIEMADRPMQRVLSQTMSDYFTGALARMGIDVRYSAGIAAIRDEAGRLSGVELMSGEVLPTSMVVAGIGVIANDELAAAAGITVDGGIVVDNTLRTSDPFVWALGDCARYPSVHAGGMTRLESVQNATDQAKYLARRLVGSEPAGAGYAELPWFWSQQGAIKLNIVGIGSADLDVVVRGDVGAGTFSVFGFRGDELVCVESVNSPADHMAARRMLGAGILPSREQIADPTFDVKAFSKQTQAAEVQQSREPLRA